jgi:hypothetical protein
MLLDETDTAPEQGGAGLLAQRTVVVGDRVWHLSLVRPFNAGVLPPTALGAGIMISLLFFFLLPGTFSTLADISTLVG